MNFVDDRGDSPLHFVFVHLFEKSCDKIVQSDWRYTNGEFVRQYLACQIFCYPIIAAIDPNRHCGTKEIRRFFRIETIGV